MSERRTTDRNTDRIGGATTGVTLQGLLGRLAVALVVALAGGSVLSVVVVSASDPQVAVGALFTLAVVVAAVRHGGRSAGRTDSVYW